MLSLSLDTSYRYLTLVLAKDSKVIASVSYEAWQKQSEFTMAELERLFAQAQLSLTDVQRIGVTIGPGSYTGIRIALTIAKVIATQLHIPLVTISSLQLLASPQGECYTLTDARAERAFVGHYRDSMAIEPDRIIPLSELVPMLKDSTVIGDRHLVGLPELPIDRISRLVELTETLEPVANPHVVVPQYLKDF